MGMGQNKARGPQLLVYVSTCQGEPFWVPIFDPQLVGFNFEPVFVVFDSPKEFPYFGHVPLFAAELL